MIHADRGSHRQRLRGDWTRLWAEFSLHEGFWLGVLFGAEPLEATDLIERSTALLRRRALHAQVLNLEDGTIDPVIRALTEPPPPSVGATVVTDVGLPIDERQDVWRRVLRRLNERRDAIVDRHRVPLLLLCPTGTLPLVREEAPDLWAFRSLTATVTRRPVPNRWWHDSFGAAIEPADPAKVPPPVAGEPARPTPEVAKLVRGMSAALARGDADHAVRLGAEADRLTSGPIDSAVVAAWLAQARSAQDEPTEAERLAMAALAAGVPFELDTTVRLLEILGDSDRPSVAHGASGQLVALRREIVNREPNTPEALWFLANSLDTFGDVAGSRGDLDAADTAYQESLTIRRQLLKAYGETPQALRDLSISLDNIGRIFEARGDPAAAAAAFREEVSTLEMLAGYGPEWADPEQLDAVRGALAAPALPNDA